MRAQSELETRILEMIEPEAKAVGLDIVRVRVMGSRTPVLQVMAERPDGGMDVEDCARLSRRLSPLLDTEDPITEKYTLEVSSPGIDRPLTRKGDFANWVGQEVRIEVGVPVNGRKRFHGYIAGETDGVVAVDLKDGTSTTIAVDDMVKAHLVLTDELIDLAQARGHIPDAVENGVDEQVFDEVIEEDAATGEGPADAFDDEEKEK
ncbi:MAG: ribosome maturation factor RimP [Hyphomonadaceae bacterium]